MNVQVLTDPFGCLPWASPALPGSTHDLTAARQHANIDALAGADVKGWANKAYQAGPRRTGYRSASLGPAALHDMDSAR
ncbi:hypothetical protein GCM10009646_89740 [Streptomyces aureus]